MNGTAIERDVVLARTGDHAAFTRIVEQTANTVCSIALAIVRNVQASEDVAQETFVAAWKGLGQLREPQSFLPWLRQITRHHAHLWRRRNEREIGNDDVLQSAIDERPRADHALIANEERELLTQVLDELSEEAREVLVLYYREGQSTKQVAALLGVSDDAVRQRLSRSRALLREEMLQRVEHVVTRTAPGAVFIAALAAVIPGPAATAAMLSAQSAVTGAAIAKASALGAVLSWGGVLVGMKLLGPPNDEREAAQLRRFRNAMLLVVTAGAAAVGFAASRSLMAMVLTLQGVYAAIAYCYLIRLPRILGERRKSRRATIGGAITAAMAGTMLMGAVVLLLRF
jgi:RNA polymerase sigma factor (sigma-70 family)